MLQRNSRNKFMDELISIGKVLNFHGIKGEVKAGYTKGKENQIKEIKTVVIEVDGADEFFSVESVRFHKQHALIKFKEVNSINDVEKIKGKDIKIQKSFAAQYLQNDEFLISDLIGLKVFNKDEELVGSIVDVGSNGVSEILEIKDANNKVHLVPFVKELVPYVDLSKNTVVINDIEGLIE